MWNYEEERRRQQKWQEEQERLLQVDGFVPVNAEFRRSELNAAPIHLHSCSKEVGGCVCF